MVAHHRREIRKGPPQYGGHRMIKVKFRNPQWTHTEGGGAGPRREGNVQEVGKGWGQQAAMAPTVL